MKRAVFTEPGRIALQELPAPELGHDDVLVAVGSCGICTWEQRVFRGVRREYPLYGGHEVGGTVLEAPDGSGLSRGDIVATSLAPRCGRCKHCSRGDDNLCAYTKDRRVTSDGPWGPGGLGELLSVPKESVFALPSGASCDNAALVEPVACVLHSLNRAGCRPGDIVLVFGLGFMGRLHLMCARAQGLRTVAVVTDRDHDGDWLEWRNDADLVIGRSNAIDILSELSECFGEAAADAAICTRGGVNSLEVAIDSMRPGGTVVVYESVESAQRIVLSPFGFRSRELTLKASLSHSSADFSDAAVLVGRGDIRPAALIGRRFVLDDVQQAVAYAVAHPGRRTMVIGNSNPSLDELSEDSE